MEVLFYMDQLCWGWSICTLFNCVHLNSGQKVSVPQLLRQGFFLEKCPLELTDHELAQVSSCLFHCSWRWAEGLWIFICHCARLLCGGIWIQDPCLWGRHSTNHLHRQESVFLLIIKFRLAHVSQSARLFSPLVSLQIVICKTNVVCSCGIQLLSLKVWHPVYKQL